MCGRYYVDEESNQELLKIIRNLDKRLQGSHNPKTNSPYTVKTGEIYPSHVVPVIANESNLIQYQPYIWGFQNNKNRSLIINARGETAPDKFMFSKPFTNMRVVIPASGFFEWSHDQNKQKFCFTDPNSTLMYMAGIATLDLNLSRFVILTTAANTSMKAIHHRMPILLKKEEIQDYILSKDYAYEVLARTPYELKSSLASSSIPSSESSYHQLNLPLE